MSQSFRAVLSPCVGICDLRDDGLCEGCLRTGDEIAAWSSLGDAARLHLMEHVLPARELAHAADTMPHAELARLQAALHPLDREPAGDAWNHDEIVDLLPAAGLAHAAVLVGLRPRASGTQVLLTRRNGGLRQHGGQVSFPGGRIDSGDASSVAAALRESHEEIGLRASLVQPLGFLDPLTTVSGFRVVPVVALVDTGFIPVPNPDEVDGVFEVPLDYLMSPERLREVHTEYRGRARTVLEYDWPGERIWGATAAILFNLRARLAG